MKHSKLFWKISDTFLATMLLLGVVYVFVSVRTAENYFKESNQRLYGDLAEHLVQEAKPFNNGKPDKAATHHIMHSMMIINPSVEVYLRTPLVILQRYVGTLLMKEELPPEERRRYLKITLDSSEKLSRLIAQLFEYSKLEARQIQPQKEPFSSATWRRTFIKNTKSSPGKRVSALRSTSHKSCRSSSPTWLWWKGWCKTSWTTP